MVVIFSQSCSLFFVSYAVTLLHLITSCHHVYRRHFNLHPTRHGLRNIVALVARPHLNLLVLIVMIGFSKVVYAVTNRVELVLIPSYNPKKGGIDSHISFQAATPHFAHFS